MKLRLQSSSRVQKGNYSALDCLPCQLGGQIQKDTVKKAFERELLFPGQAAGIERMKTAQLGMGVPWKKEGCNDCQEVIDRRAGSVEERLSTPGLQKVPGGISSISCERLSGGRR